VDKHGDTVDFLLRASRAHAAARRFFDKAIDQNGAPDTVTIDGSTANLAALHDINAEREAPIVIRQFKYLNNIVEQDHRAIKRVTRPMLGFKDFRCASILLGGIELMHMIAKGQIRRSERSTASAAQQFYALAASKTTPPEFGRLRTLIATIPFSMPRRAMRGSIARLRKCSRQRAKS